MTEPENSPANDTHPTKTAAITGASSGIGEVFARELAAEGYNLLLVARREERLWSLADELRERHGVESEIFTADLTVPDDVRRLEQRLADHPSLAMLVNNAGFGVGGLFAETDVSKQIEMIDVHVVAPVRFTRAVLPGMIAAGGGAVINLASVAGYLTGPGSATYCATKGYLISFSESLAIELRGTGVRVQALCPGFTYTEFHDSPEYGKFDRSKIPGFLWMPARFVVRTSLRSLARGRVVCIPGLRYRLIVAVLRNAILGPVVQLLFQDRLEK